MVYIWPFDNITYNFIWIPISYKFFIRYLIYKCGHILLNCNTSNFFSPLFIGFLKYYLLWSSAIIATLLIVNIYGGSMEGLAGREERSFPHVLCWQYGSSSLKQMVITLVLRILPLQSWTWHFSSKSSSLHKQTAPLGAIKWNKRNDQWTIEYSY